MISPASLANPWKAVFGFALAKKCAIVANQEVRGG